MLALYNILHYKKKLAPTVYAIMHLKHYSKR